MTTGNERPAISINFSTTTKKRNWIFLQLAVTPQVLCYRRWSVKHISGSDERSVPSKTHAPKQAELYMAFYTICIACSVWCPDVLERSSTNVFDMTLYVTPIEARWLHSVPPGFACRNSTFLPTQRSCEYVFSVSPTRKWGHVPAHNPPIGFCDGDGMCTLRRTNLTFKYNAGYVLFSKGLW